MRRGLERSFRRSVIGRQGSASDGGECLLSARSHVIGPYDTMLLYRMSTQRGTDPRICLLRCLRAPMGHETPNECCGPSSVNAKYMYTQLTQVSMLAERPTQDASVSILTALRRPDREQPAADCAAGGSGADALPRMVRPLPLPRPRTRQDHRRPPRGMGAAVRLGRSASVFSDGYDRSKMEQPCRSTDSVPGLMDSSWRLSATQKLQAC